jgi:hypothetical protein
MRDGDLQLAFRALRSARESEGGDPQRFWTVTGNLNGEAQRLAVSSNVLLRKAGAEE